MKWQWFLVGFSLVLKELSPDNVAPCVVLMQGCFWTVEFVLSNPTLKSAVQAHTALKRLMRTVKNQNNQSILCKVLMNSIKLNISSRQNKKEGNFVCFVLGDVPNVFKHHLFIGSSWSQSVAESHQWGHKTQEVGLNRSINTLTEK